MHLFGKSTAKKPTSSPADAILKLSEQENLLQKRSDKLQSDIRKIQSEALALKKAKNIKSATNKLKQKKRLEQAIDQIEAQKDNIQTIKMKLEEAVLHSGMADAMKGARDALVFATKDKEKLEDVIDDTKDAIADADEMSRILGETVDTGVYDEDDLLQELEDLEQEEIDAQVNTIDLGEEEVLPAPARVPAAPAAVPASERPVQLPSVPAAKPGAPLPAAAAKHRSKEEEELAILEASMM
uniref:Uncharacterized protein n=1 Tax=Cryptomonas curvata TaxID=233186 RepID=A0A7S0MWK1_9CRYP